ncbi:BON domain-containing protein [Achromobacter xylosoxidans]|uniref:BON domain-containing protein n=1 Tax=Alcaligenes xylosoxydans xylosoxydans TaxID=85698 RepID=UPI001564C5D9|nr:BON domain-containing protein [Achromobacter xylosoxidans]
MTARVREALIRAPGLRSNTIQVETYRGTVQLSGFADDEDSAANAIAAARQVPGVNEVRNNIQVRKPQ